MKRESFWYALWMCLLMPGCVFAGTVQTDVCDPYVTVLTSDGKVNGAGTVVTVGSDTLILTAAHVVTSQAVPTPAGLVFPYPIKVRSRGRQYGCSVAVYSEDRDLVLLRPADPSGLTPARVAPSYTPARGEDVWYIGAGRLLEDSLERTILNRPDVQRGGRTYLAFNGNGWYGSSGGGVFVQQGSGYVLVSVVQEIWHWEFKAGPMMGPTFPEIRDFLNTYRMERIDE